VTAAHAGDIVCRRGCTGCCLPGLTLLPLEFNHLKDAFEKLPGHVRAAVLTRTRASACALLLNGGCVVYAERPLVCRTHGLPVLIKDSGRAYRDCCPKNFQHTALARLPADCVLHLERLNQILISLNLLFSRSRRIDAGKRIPVAHLLAGKS
jgi:uncharacterized protein